MGALFLHVPILAVSVLLLVSSFKNNTIYGFQGTDWLMIMGLVGLLGLFLFPFNGARLSKLNAQTAFLSNYPDHEDFQKGDTVPEKLKLVAAPTEEGEEPTKIHELQGEYNSYMKKHDHITYIWASFLFVPWWIFLANYVVCILIGAGVIEHEDVKDVDVV